MSAFARPQIPAHVFASMAKVNPHLAAGLGVSLLLTSGLGVVAFFGDPTAAESQVIRPITRPAPATIVRAPSLRGATEIAIDGPVEFAEVDPDTGLDAHTDAHDRPAEPRLPGVPDHLDPDLGAQVNAPSAASAEPRAARANGKHALAKAPFEGLTSPGPGGPLPAIGPDGTTPAQAYARPFTAPEDRPLIAVMVGGLGLSASVTRTAIETLPPEVTLSFVPYVDNLQDWIDQARAAGHEVVIELPMEPFDYPANDPGPYTLLADADAAENARRLDWLMARATGYFAVTNYLGARYTASERAVSPMLRTLKQRGVAFVHDGETRRSALGRAAGVAGVAYGAAERVLDSEPSAAKVDEQLLELEALAIQNGAALGVGAAYPVTITQLARWTESLDLKGYALAPASAILAATPAAQAETQADLMPVNAAPTIPTFTSVPAAFGPKRGGEADAAEAGGKADGHGAPAKTDAKPDKGGH